VCEKLLNDRRRLQFGPLERIYLKKVLGIRDPLDITTELKQRMLLDPDVRYNALRECYRELREKAERERRRRSTVATQKRLDREKKQDDDRRIRVPIVELALLGWGNRREPLGQEQLKYLLDDLSNTGYTPRKYITRDLSSNSIVSQQTLYMIGDGAAFLKMLLSASPLIDREVAVLRRRLKRRACDAVLANATTFDVLVADYLTHVEKVVGFRADASGQVEQSALGALYESEFTRKCRQAKRRRDAKGGGAYSGGGDGADAMDDDSDDLFGLGPLRSVDAGGGDGGGGDSDDGYGYGGGSGESDDGLDAIRRLGPLVAIPDDGIRPYVPDLPDVLVPGLD
jgi:hypothetical protein